MAMQAPIKRPLQVSLNGSGGRMSAHGIGSTGKLRVLRIDVRMEPKYFRKWRGRYVGGFYVEKF
jgi:hypothetical protein